MTVYRHVRRVMTNYIAPAHKQDRGQCGAPFLLRPTLESHPLG
jgi:hypothetical protein